MQINLAAAENTSRPPLMTWRKLLLVGVFLLTLVVTVFVGNLVVGFVRPAAADDPEALKAMLAEISSASSPIDADLAALGFHMEGADGTTASTVPLTPVKALQTPAVLTGTIAPQTQTIGSGVTITPTATATASAPTATATPNLPTWDRKGRVNILLMGLDGKASSGRYRRADTLIVASIDPATNSAVLIGMPRDLYVTINTPKGAIRNKINTAYVWGELYKYPGGGPALQMRTVSEFLGIPIHNYVSVYFDGFAKLIDAIGGIDINIPTAIYDAHLKVSFKVGMEHMDGWRALDYARSRFSTSDFSRGRRQQQVILAAITKIAKAGTIAKLPAILPTVSEAFRSDMSITELLSLASLGYKMDLSTIKTAQVDEKMCQSGTSPDGMSILVPRMDRVKAMVAEAMKPVALPTATAVPAATTPGAAATTPAAAASATAAPTQTAAPNARSENATIEVLNGTNTIGLARRTQTWLQKEGFKVTRIADATGIYNQTVIYTDGTKPATRDALVKLLNIQPQNIKSLSAGGVNVRIILGKDAKIP